MSQDQGEDISALEGREIVENGESSIEDLMRDLGIGPAELRRYLKAAKRLRELERRYGKSYHILLREYEKKFKETVKLEYAISELKEKRSKIEEDLRIYLDQHRLTLDNVNRTVRLLSALNKYNVSLDDVESFAKVVGHLKSLGWDVGELVATLENLENLKERIEQLRSEKTKMEKELEKLGDTIRIKEERLKEIAGFELEISDLAAVREKLANELRDLEKRAGEQALRLEEMAHEYEVLAGMKGSANEIFKELQERKATLQRLDEEIAKKSETVRVLEEEIEAARSLLTLLQDPETVQKEDLEALSQQLNNIIRVRNGELSMLKPLEASLVQNARKRVVELVWPAIKNEFVPKWVFDKLEKEVKDLVARKAQLEGEVETLTKENEELRKRLLEKPETPPSPPATPEEKPRVFTIKESGRELSATGKKVNVKCPHCTAYNLMHLPTREEIQVAIDGKEKLALTCTSCSKLITLDPTVLSRFY
jgi:chromosome segregation ATPase